MREALFILLVLLILAAWTVFRYRRHLFGAVEFYRAVQGIRERASKPQVSDEPVAKGPLVLCQKCGTWVPEHKAIRLGRSGFYCSSKCLETSKVG